MNPYNLLNKIAAFNALRATLVKSDGRRISLIVEPESGETETVGGSTAPGAINVRAWSTQADEREIDNFPGPGDALEVEDANGQTKKYKTTRDAKNGRYWTWRYLRRGTRIVFYTKYNPD